MYTNTISFCISGLLAFTLSAGAQTALLDFNTAAAAPVGFTSFADTTAGQTVAIGSDTITLGFTNFTDSAFALSNSGSFASTQFDLASRDYFFIRGTSEAGLTATLTLTGFTGSNYSIAIASSSDAAGNDRNADFSINGSFADSGPDSAPHGEGFDAFTDGYSTGETLVWNNITPVGGVITLNVVTPAGSSGLGGARADYIGFLNGMSITQVPEPGTYALIAGIGVLALVIRRRK